MSAEAHGPDGGAVAVDVSIVIPFTERDAWFDRAVRSAETALAAAPEIAGEILPVDDIARRGVSHARNEGIVRARGAWVVFLDADDALGERFFADILLPLKDNAEIDLIVCGYEISTDGADAFTARSGLLKRRFLCGVPCRIRTAALKSERERPQSAVNASDPGGDIESRLRGGRFQVASQVEVLTGYAYIEQRILRQDTHVWAKAFRRSAIAGGEDASAIVFDETLTIGEDMLFLVDFALRAGKRRAIAVTQTPGYCYTVNPAGAMEKPYEPSYLDELRSWGRAQERLLPNAAAFSPYTFSALGTVRVRTALMVPLKIARTVGEDAWKEPAIGEALTQTRDAVRSALRANGAFAGLTVREKAKTLLFLRFPGKFLQLAKKD